MKTLQIRDVTNKETWETFVQSQSPSVVLQSWNWGQFQKSLGRDVWYLGIYEEDELVGACLAYLIPTKFRTHIYTSNGPIIDWDTGEGTVHELLSFLQKKGDELGAVFVRIDPLIADTVKNKSMLQNLGFKQSTTNTQAENRWILDITPDEDTLLAEMKKNTRYAIRRSHKEGVRVEHSTDPNDFDKFWPLFQQTVESQNFVPHTKNYYIKQIEAFAQDEQYRIYWSHLDGKILAAALIPFYGDSAYYLHAASSNEIRNTFPAHALIWRAITDAKEQGLEYFDFWGIAPSEDPNHPWAGFTFFKKSFGGFQQDVIRAHDYPLSPMYQFVRLLESTRRTWGKAYYKLLQQRS